MLQLLYNIIEKSINYYRAERPKLGMFYLLEIHLSLICGLNSKVATHTIIMGGGGGGGDGGWVSPLSADVSTCHTQLISLL